MFEITVGDRAQARKIVGDDVAAVTEFTVTAIDGGVVTGSPIGVLDEADGWQFELVRRGNPGLPETLSDLGAWLVQDRTTRVRIVGPLAGRWQTATGIAVDPGDVLAWEPWTE